jgi:hypothetical protein
MTSDNPHDAPGLWMSISELAAHKRVTKQTISAKVARLVADGLLITKPGPGRQKLINLAQYDTAIGNVGDGAREQGAATKREYATQAAPRLSDGGKFRDEQTREKAYAADLKFIELERARGNLLEVAEFDAIAGDSAACISDLLTGLKTHADELTQIAKREGEHGVWAALKRIERAMRDEIVLSLKDMAAQAKARAALGAVSIQPDAERAPTEKPDDR